MMWYHDFGPNCRHSLDNAWNADNRRTIAGHTKDNARYRPDNGGHSKDNGRHSQITGSIPR